MSLIVKGGKTAKDKEKRQLYTWAACIFVALFLVSVAVPMLSGGGNESGNKYKDSYYDLANMPFSSDAAEAELLASAQYQDIGKADLINTLFSKKDKEERQAEDELLGVPPPPDEDYKQAEIQKEGIARAAQRAAQRASAPSRAIAPTQKGALRGGSMVTGGGGGTSARGNIWTSESNSKQKNDLQAKALAPNAQQVADELRKGGRGSSYFNAYEKSLEAGRAKDAESAAGSAIDAFQDGQGGQGENLQGELENAMAELGGDTVDPNNMRMPNPEGVGDLKQKLEGAKNRAQNQRERCKSILDGLDCVLDKIATAAIDGVMEWGVDGLYGWTGVTTRGGGDKTKKSNNSGGTTETGTGTSGE